MKGKQTETLTATCVYCGEKTFSLYEKQLKHNIKVHEMNCPVRIAEERKNEKD